MVEKIPLQDYFKYMNLLRFDIGLARLKTPVSTSIKAQLKYWNIVQMKYHGLQVELNRTNNYARNGT